MRKRIFALLLALVMALGLCVTTAWADGEIVHELLQSDITDGTYWLTIDDPYYLKGGSYKLMGDIELTEALQVTGSSTDDVTIDLNGHTLSLKSGVQDSVLYVVSNTLTLQDSSAAKTGKITGGTGFKNSSDDPSIGGGVEVYSGFFYMYGGTITGCTADQGGGVYVDGGGSFLMYGGTITDCTATQGGGAVYLENGTMYANGGTVNGTVYVGGYGTITASDDYVNCYDKQTVFLDTVTTKSSLSGGVYKKALVRGAGIAGKIWLWGGLYWVNPIDGVNFGMESTFHTATYMNGDEEYAKAFAIVYDEGTLGTSCTFAEPDTPVREGYTFLGWYYRNDDGNEVKWDFAKDKAVTTEANQMGTSHTFYAKWEQNPDPTTPDEDNGGHTPIRRQNTTTITDTTTDTTKTDTVTSAKTFDAGIAMYVGMSLMSVAGTAVVIGKKKEF